MAEYYTADIKPMISLLLKQNRAIMKRMDRLEEFVANQQTFAVKSGKEKINIPNDVRYHVKLAYKEGHKQNMRDWKIGNDFGPFHDDNLKTTKYIRNFVAALHPNLENRDTLINMAIKTYYESKKTQQRKKNNNPDRYKDAARNQRRIHKAQRRRRALEKVSDDVISKEEKVNFAKALIPEMMSSEEEKEDENGERYFERKIPSFRDKKFQKLFDVIDKTYIKNSSKLSKEQMVKRENVTPFKRRAPRSLDFGYELFVEKK